jgi:hypothetical protein
MKIKLIVIILIIISFTVSVWFYSGLQAVGANATGGLASDYQNANDKLKCILWETNASEYTNPSSPTYVGSGNFTPSKCPNILGNTSK